MMVSPLFFLSFPFLPLLFPSTHSPQKHNNAFVDLFFRYQYQPQEFKTVHLNVLLCLTYLCLKSELGGIHALQNNLNKDSDQPCLSKKQKKVMQEKKQITAEMHEAAAEVDQEEQATMVGGCQSACNGWALVGLC